jgi:hypothetical protein
VIQFIDKAPMGRSVPIMVSIGEPGRGSPAHDAIAQEWYIDTGFQNEAFCWRVHMERAGIDPSTHHVPGRFEALSAALHADKRPIKLPYRVADLWIISNVEGISPLRLELDPGILVRDAHVATPNREPRALIGMRALRRAKAQLQLDFEQGVYSLYLPDDYPQLISKS